MSVIPREVAETITEEDSVRLLASVDGNGNPRIWSVDVALKSDEVLLCDAHPRTELDIATGGRLSLNVYSSRLAIAFQLKGTCQGTTKQGRTGACLEMRVDEVYSAGGFLSGRRIVPPEPYTEESSHRNKRDVIEEAP